MGVSYQREVGGLHAPTEKGGLYTATSSGTYKSTFIDTTFGTPNRWRKYRPTKGLQTCTCYKHLQDARL